jgi:5'-nucleotidase
MPRDVDALNLNIPSSATPNTPCRTTRLSQCRYFVPLPPDRVNGHGRPRYKVMEDPDLTETDSDVWALRVNRVVSVTPLSLDLTSRINLQTMDLVLPSKGEFFPSVQSHAHFLPMSEPLLAGQLSVVEGD